MHTPEILISAALIVFAIVVAAALVAVCIVVAGSFVSITTALSDRSPRFFPVRRRARRADSEEREEDEAASETAAAREPQIDQLATEIASNAAEGIVVYDRNMRCI